MLDIVIHPQGNKREVPPDVPTMAWIEAMRELASLPNRDEVLAEIPWAHPVMEYLEPKLLIRLKVQALIWRWDTGEWPDEIAYWWPVRLGRRPVCIACHYRSENNTEVCDRCGGPTEPAQVPHGEWSAECIIREDGVLVCGFCGARWSPNHDGSPHEDRCQLCDRISVVIKDEREAREYVTGHF